jgi:tRNA G37 N-methylase TrmD
LRAGVIALAPQYARITHEQDLHAALPAVQRHGNHIKITLCALDALRALDLLQRTDLVAQHRRPLVIQAWAACSMSSARRTSSSRDLPCRNRVVFSTCSA